MKMQTNRVEINLGNGKRLVAEVNPDNDYKEIYIGVETIEENPIWVQDLAIVRSAYHYDENDKVINDVDTMEVLVYSDSESEDYTHSFAVDVIPDEE